MSIRMIAEELYRLIREVEALEKRLAHALPEQREALGESLRTARAERNRMRKMLEGQKG